MAEWLLAQGSDVRAWDRDGKTALDFAYDDGMRALLQAARDEQEAKRKKDEELAKLGLLPKRGAAPPRPPSTS